MNCELAILGVGFLCKNHNYKLAQLQHNKVCMNHRLHSYTRQPDMSMPNPSYLKITEQSNTGDCEGLEMRLYLGS